MYGEPGSPRMEIYLATLGWRYTEDLEALRRTEKLYGEPGSPKEDCVRGTWQP